MIRLNMKKQLLNMATIGVIGLYLFYNIAYFMYGCIAEFDSHHDYEEAVYKPLQWCTDLLFTMLTVLFIVIGVILIR